MQDTMASVRGRYHAGESDAGQRQQLNGQAYVKLYMRACVAGGKTLMDGQ